MEAIDAHVKLYINKVDQFCRNQQEIIKLLKVYRDIKEGYLSKEEVEELYDEYFCDDEYYEVETYEEKLAYLEKETLRLIHVNKEVLLENISVSYKRLDVLLGLLGGLNAK